MPSTCLAQNTLRVGPTETYLTVQSAINAAQTGDTVLVDAGTYYEHLTITTKEITVRSTDGAAKTILDGSHTGVILTVEHTPSLATDIDGFTFQNGSSGTTPAEAGIVVELGGATIQNSHFTSNYGDAIDASNGSVVVRNNTFEIASPQGGTYCVLGDAIRLFGNLTLGDTSGPWVPDQIVGNTITGDGTACSGEGILGTVFLATIENNIIANTSLGINLFLGAATIRQNLVYGSRGGGLSISHASTTNPYTDPADTLITNNTFVNNLTSIYPGDEALSGDILISEYVSKLSFSNNIIVGYSSKSPTFNCLTAGGDTPPILDHNDVINLSSTPFLPYYSGPCLDTVSTEIGLDGNVSVDPHFVSAADFHLQSGSPVLDAGNNSAPIALLDLEGNARILDSTGQGFPVVDMGVYERSGTTDASLLTLNLTASSYLLAAGSGLTLTAAPASSPAISTGTITFYQNDVVIGTETVVAGAPVGLPVTNLAPGLYRFRAHLSSTSASTPADSTVIYVYVSAYVPRISLVSSTNPSYLGQSVTFTATITSPDGAVLTPINFLVNGQQQASISTSANDTAAFSTASLALGYSTILAKFPGDATHSSVSSSLSQQVLNGMATTTTLNATPNPGTVFQPITVSAHVADTTSPATVPAGAVSFTDSLTGTSSTQPLDTSGNASLTYPSLISGAHPITATYKPTGTFASSTANLTEQVNGLDTVAVLTLNPASPTVGGSLTLNAAVSPKVPTTNGVPTGTVTFTIDGANAGQTSVDGTGHATLPTSGFTGGPHTFACHYNGDGNFNPSTCGGVLTTVAAAASTLKLSTSGTPAYASTNVTFTASLTGPNASPVANASVLLTIGSSPVTLTTNTSGTATYSTTSLAPGTYPVAAVFTGNASYLSSGDSLQQVIVVNPVSISLTGAPNPAYPSQTVTLTAATNLTGLTASPGSVTFSEGSTPLGTSAVDPSTGKATLPISTLSVGDHVLIAVFTPSTANYTAATSTSYTETILPSAFTLTLTPPQLNLPLGQPGSTTVQLNSVGAFAGPLTLSTGQVPTYAAARFSTTTVTLAAGGSATANLTLTTFTLAQNTHSPREPIFLATLLLALLPFTRRRKLFTRALLALAAVALTQTLTGCVNAYYTPDHLAPGTYTIPVIATDSNHVQQSATLTVVVQ